jgi:general secretion pathway protein K
MKRLLKAHIKEQRGFALLMTILIISMIVPFTLQFNTFMRSELYGAANLRDGVQLDHIARSGFHVALAVLYEDALETKFDSLQEYWADPLTFSPASQFEEGRFEVRIKDHSGRIHINKLVDTKGKVNKNQRELLERFFNSEEFDLEPEDVGDILDAMTDWIDPDNEVTKFGAEDSYYQSLEKPYACKNGPMEFLDELLLVKGITRELFYGEEGRPGISSYLTTHGQGLININTAEPLILRSLSQHMDQEIVEEMVSFRENEENDLSKPVWYKKVQGMSSEVKIDDLVTTSSHFFEINSVGLKGAMSKAVTSLVERKEGGLTVVSWSVE